MNISTYSPSEETLAEFFRILGQPVRIQILLVISEGEACVCHLEAHLGLRQAAISQHLMILRKAGLVTPHRDGRNIFYRLARPDLLDMIRQAAALAGLDPSRLQGAPPLSPCPCPHCNPEQPPGDCSTLRPIR